MLTLDGKTVAAVGPLMEQGATPSWTLYFQTQDANATAEAVRQAGGAVRADPFDVFTQGRMGQFSDPSGGNFAVWQPGDTKGRRREQLRRHDASRSADDGGRHDDDLAPVL